MDQTRLQQWAGQIKPVLPDYGDDYISATMFVDGSWIPKNKKNSGYGIFLIWPHLFQKKYSNGDNYDYRVFSGSLIDDEFDEEDDSLDEEEKLINLINHIFLNEQMRNVSGELKAVLVGTMNITSSLISEISASKKEDCKKIILNIYYDYSGIEKWITGEWKAKNPATQVYVKLMESFKDSCEKEGIQLIYRFHKVLAHSNNILNDFVDALAKYSITPIKENGHFQINNGFVILGSAIDEFSLAKSINLILSDQFELSHISAFFR